MAAPRIMPRLRSGPTPATSSPLATAHAGHSSRVCRAESTPPHNVDRRVTRPDQEYPYFPALSYTITSSLSFLFSLSRFSHLTYSLSFFQLQFSPPNLSLSYSLRPFTSAFISYYSIPNSFSYPILLYIPVLFYSFYLLFFFPNSY